MPSLSSSNSGGIGGLWYSGPKLRRPRNSARHRPKPVSVRFVWTAFIFPPVESFSFTPASTWPTSLVFNPGLSPITIGTWWSSACCVGGRWSDSPPGYLCTILLILRLEARIYEFMGRVLESARVIRGPTPKLMSEPTFGNPFWSLKLGWAYAIGTGLLGGFSLINARHQ